VSHSSSAFTRFFATIAEAPWFQHFITGVILAAGVVVGFETYPAVAAKHGPLLHTLNDVVLYIFIAEVIIKMLAHGRRPWRYFLDPWNVFDFAIVAVCLLPIDAQFVTVLRLARLLRVLKLVRALPQLQVLVGALLRSIPSMLYISLMLAMLFYLYGVAGTFLFGENDPVHFRSLQLSMLSLFRVVTLEDWTDIMYIQMYGSEHYGYDAAMLAEWQPVSQTRPVLGAGFFVTFVLFGTMVVLNLFIGVIMNGMDQAQKEADQSERDRLRGGGVRTMHDELAEVNERLVELNDLVEQVQTMAKRIRTAGQEGGTR
jgi:voltage-gated sodium channel